MFYIISLSRQEQSAYIEEQKMPHQMTQEEVNNYALRMFNDDYWDKTYTPNIEGLKLLENIEHGVHLELPVVLKTERHCVGEDDDEEYADRPNAMEEDLADDDRGEITIPFTIAIPYPINLDLVNELDIDSMIRDLGFEIKTIGDATMYDGSMKLEQVAYDHLLARINTDYMVFDTFDQHHGLILKLAEKAKSLKVEEDPAPHSIFA